MRENTKKTPKTDQDDPNTKHSKASTTCNGTHINRSSGRSRKKSQISRDFWGQIRGKNGRFRGKFAGLFEVSFTEK